MKRKDFVASGRSLLCSEHFRPHEFDSTGQTVRLRHGVKPSVFNFPSRSQKVFVPFYVCTCRDKVQWSKNVLLPFFHFSERYQGQQKLRGEQKRACQRSRLSHSMKLDLILAPWVFACKHTRASSPWLLKPASHLLSATDFRRTHIHMGRRYIKTYCSYFYIPLCPCDLRCNQWDWRMKLRRRTSFSSKHHCIFLSLFPIGPQLCFACFSDGSEGPT